MANTYLTRTSSSTGNRKTWTLSAWVKRSTVGTKHGIFGTYTDANNRLDFAFDTADKLTMKEKSGGTTVIDFTTTQNFRDTSGWYHIVFKVDTTQATSGDRVKIYVNGSEITSWVDSTQPSQNYDTLMNVTGRSYLIGQTGGNANYWDGCMSHVHLTDGAAYTPSTFGSTDSATGQWKINTNPSVSYGSNGFFMLKDDASLSDDSGQGNNFTVGGGTITPTQDCPSNVFCTFNTLATQGNNRTMGNGGTYVGNNSNNTWNCLFGTLTATSGKFYCEIKDESDWGSTSDSTRRYGIVNLDASIDHRLATAVDIRFSDNNYAYAYMNASGVRHSGSTLSGTTSTHPTFQEGDIIMIAMDLDNNKLYFGKNGTWNNSANPASGATGTGSVANIADGLWTFYAETKYGSDNCSINSGNGYHRTTAISSEGTNASNLGKFEYDVPAGYTALCTKGLNE